MEARVTISALEADADTLLEIVVMSEREVQARGSLPARTGLAMLPIVGVPVPFGAASAIVDDPLGPTYRVELQRIGSDIHEIGGVDAVDEAIISIALRDPTHADWRAVILERAWSRIGRDAE
jgi:hypothetical protein